MGQVHVFATCLIPFQVAVLFNVYFCCYYVVLFIYFILFVRRVDSNIVSQIDS